MSSARAARQQRRVAREKPQPVAAAASVIVPQSKAVGAILTVLLAVTPLGLLTEVLLSHDVIPKVVMILAGGALLLFLLPKWAGGLSVLWRGTEGRIFLCLVVAEAISLALSTAFSTQPMLSFAGTVWRRFGAVEQVATLVIVMAIASTAAVRPEWTRSLFRAVIICGGVAALYGTLQYFGVDPFLPREWYAIDYLGGIVRPPATMGHAIYYSAYLVPIVLIAAASAFSETARIWKRIGAAVAVLGALAIILSGTRASLLALAVGGIVLGVQLRSVGLRQLLIGSAAILAITTAFVISPLGDNFRHRLQQWREDPGGPRVGVWRDSLTLIGERPLLGSGPETFAVEFRRIESAALSRAYPDFYHETPHNAFLDAAFAQGIPGALILAGLFAMGWRSGADRGLQAAMAGMLIGSFFASFSLVTSMYLWAIAGVAAALSVSGRPRQPQGEPLILWLVPASLTGGVFIVVGALLAVSDAQYSKLQDAVDAKDFAAANAAWSAASAYSFGMPGYELWSSREMATLARALRKSPLSATAWSKARDASTLAEKQGEERFSAAYQSAILAVAAGDVAGAEAKARATIGMAPNWYKPHLLLAQILQATGRNDEAGQEARLSSELGWKRQ